ncbi:small, acid-soluble spore protein [Heyndrickxia coagulans]|jgi:small acid-soluble spore protein F (minor alpha/beta-type SASP)|uniref:Small acid-soluble spore protein, minor alpha/beta-type SASP n=3 Tax=Heyndrickxia TaxID=2837504 RepID=A0AAN0TAP5_HEYCO|nr:small acid-soluble spore protein, minor alpha/beta-type SASP [Heyndrickxia coagulans]AKN53579.1 small, acid-soluble spore protein [Heyndrickxia coagulans]
MQGYNNQMKGKAGIFLSFPSKGEIYLMGRRRGIMSERFKEELAKDLGFYDVVQEEGWGGIKARDAGNMVKRAIELAEEHLASEKQSGNS